MRWLAPLLIAAATVPALADGNVVATMTGKMLTLTGDTGSNTFVIAPGGDTNALTVTPTNGTMLNGALVAVVFPDVRSITAETGAGNDRIDFSKINLRGNVKVRLGDGNDTVFFTGSTIRGRTTVRGEAGSDTIRAEASAVFFGGFVAKGEGENDELQFVSSQFRSRFRCDAGTGDDHVLVQSVTTGEFARMELVGSRGLDLVELLTCTCGNDAFIDAGPDNDRVRVLTTKFALDLFVFGGLAPLDVLSLEGTSTFGHRKVFGGFEEGQP